MLTEKISEKLELILQFSPSSSPASIYLKLQIRATVHLAVKKHHGLDTVRAAGYPSLSHDQPDTSWLTFLSTSHSTEKHQAN